jgi:hypothetical protein
MFQFGKVCQIIGSLSETFDLAMVKAFIFGLHNLWRFIDESLHFSDT